jgi:hypothetical protein
VKQNAKRQAEEEARKKLPQTVHAHVSAYPTDHVYTHQEGVFLSRFALIALEAMKSVARVRSGTPAIYAGGTKKAAVMAVSIYPLSTCLLNT